MMVHRRWLPMTVFLAFVAAGASAQSTAATAADATAFMGTWVINMREHGVPIWSVMSLSLDGDTINAALMVERNQTIKKGPGSKQIN